MYMYENVILDWISRREKIGNSSALAPLETPVALQPTGVFPGGLPELSSLTFSGIAELL
jgi:hypothetical protein